MRFFIIMLASVFSQLSYGSDYTVSLLGGLGMFQQQVKSKVGDERAEPVVDESHVQLLSRLNIVEPNFQWGVSLRLDAGKRKAGQFEGLDENNKTVTSTRLGGAYTEYWIGPFIELPLSPFYLGMNYGLFIRRDDAGRSDIPDSKGRDNRTFRPMSTVAWSFYGGLISQLPWEGVVLNTQMEYRIRYYNRRDSTKLISDVVHGTQDLVLMSGVTFSI